MKQQPITLSVEQITKSFGTNVIVAEVSFTVAKGEVVALVGCNGSGKSTLLKMIYGTIVPDSGVVKINDTVLKSGNPAAARLQGVEMVFQDKDEESKLCPNISVLENLFLGHEPVSKVGLVQYKKMRQSAEQMAENYQSPLPPLDRKFSDLSGGQQKAVAIGRALLANPQILLLDEPTAPLGVIERKQVHAVIPRLKSLGIGIILCSHSTEEVMQLADRVIALRAGELIADTAVKNQSDKDIALLMSK